jgi:hypothetical protein
MADKDLTWERFMEKRAHWLEDDDPEFDRWVERGANAMRALHTFLDARGILPGNAGTGMFQRVFEIHNWLARFDHRETRRWELDRMEQLFWTDTPVHQSGRQAIALWRLHQQLLDHSD